MPYSTPVKTPQGWILPKKTGGVHKSSKGKTVHFKSKARASRAASHIMDSKKKYKVNNKMKGAYGQTTFNKKGTVIEINKKKHKGIKKDQTIPKKSRTLLDTIAHETMHAEHPKMHEKTVRKLTPKKVSKMSKKAKKRLYNKVK